MIRVQVKARKAQSVRAQGKVQSVKAQSLGFAYLTRPQRQPLTWSSAYVTQKLGKNVTLQ